MVNLNLSNIQVYFPVPKYGEIRLLVYVFKWCLKGGTSVNLGMIALKLDSLGNAQK